MQADADFVVFGGSAGGGKSYGLLMDAARGIGDPSYNGILFRRKYTEIVLPGALWDTSRNLYQPLGGTPNTGRREWRWGYAGAKVKFSHLTEEKTCYDHQGGQYAWIGFDELTEFSLFQVMYLLTRNRPPDNCKMRPRARGTCNPDADSWVARFIAWWINQETGFYIPERVGVIRWFHIVKYEPEWVDAGWRDEYGNPPISCTFIPAKLTDNPILMSRDPTYMSKLAGMDHVTRERLLNGNWLITFSGNMFDPSWFGYVDYKPEGVRFVRYWDLAASEVDEKNKNDPDWTAGVLVCISGGEFIICDVIAFRETPGKAEKLMRAAAERDGPGVEQWWEEERGSSGKWANQYMEQIFAGYVCHADPVTGSKVERAKMWSSWAEHGRVKLVRGAWNRQFLARAGKFPEGKKDEIDGASGAFKALVGVQRVLDRYTDWAFQSFNRDKPDFEKVQAQNVEVYVVLWTDTDGSFYGGCYIWSLVNARLRLYNDIYMPHPTAVELYREIVDKLVVQIESKSGFVALTRAIGNDLFFNVCNENVAKELRKHGLRVRQQHNYDESQAIIRLNRMFDLNQVIVHKDCIETDVQIKSWMYEDKKPAKGYQLARAMCLLVNDLRESGRLTRPPQPAAYSYQKQKIREQLKSDGLYQAPKAIDRDKQYEYLVR